jgi:hypothetical protein
MTGRLAQAVYCSAIKWQFLRIFGAAFTIAMPGFAGVATASCIPAGFAKMPVQGGMLRNLSE